MPAPDSIAREEAIKAVSLMTLRTWSVEQRREKLDTMKLEAWSDHPGWALLPLELRDELEGGAETERPEDSRYDPALLLGLELSLRGVRNEFLGQQLGRVVVGPVEALLPCPCCGYRTLAERGSYEICPVCFWEDDGSVEPGRVSGPNHMTLAQARANFKTFGAVSERELRFVDPEGRAKYVPGE